MPRHPQRRAPGLTARRAAARPVVLAVAAVLAALLLAQAAPSAAGQIEDLRKTGAVGERFDGYAVVRANDAPAEMKKAVDEINAKRREIYQKRADEESVPVEQVGRVYAKKIFEEALSGTWFLGEDKEWVKKK